MAHDETEIESSNYGGSEELVSGDSRVEKDLRGTNERMMTKWWSVAAVVATLEIQE